MKKRFKFAPLNSVYMAISLIGLLVSFFYLIDPTIRFDQVLISFFLLIFITSLFTKDTSNISYMYASIIGFIASLIFGLNPDPTWAVAFMIFFGIMFVSAMS